MMKPDRSYLAARRQLEAMRAESFEVGIRSKEGKMIIRTWSMRETLQAMSWLKRENARGCDIYVRPAGETNCGLVLVDDINRRQLAQMQADGMAAACVIETSPDNFQAWVRVHNDHLAPKLATEVAKMLSKQYESDPNSADWRHFGRLAGFTNTKPQYKDANGRSPYVLAHESSGKVAPAGPSLVQQATQLLQVQEASIERENRIRAIKATSGHTNGRGPIDTYRRGLNALYARFGPLMDVSRADYMIGVDMARSGFTAEQIERAIEQASPELPTRKAGHAGDYVARTVKAIMNSPKVAEWQQAKAAQRSNKRAKRSHGPDLDI